MRESFEILTRKKTGQSHRKTLVTIDWTGITEQELKFLAKQLLVYDLQARIQNGNFEGFPQEITINAVDEVHIEKVCMKRYEVPASWKDGDDKKKTKVEKLTPLEQILNAKLSQAEIDQILAML